MFNNLLAKSLKILRTDFCSWCKPAPAHHCLAHTCLPDNMINDDGLWWHKQGVEPLGDLWKLHTLRLKDLWERGEAAKSTISAPVDLSKRMGPFLTCWRYLSQMTNSRSCGSWSLCVLIYCHSAWMITGRVWVWMPSSRARRGSNLNWGGCREPKSIEMKLMSWVYVHYEVLGMAICSSHSTGINAVLSLGQKNTNRNSEMTKTLSLYLGR